MMRARCVSAVLAFDIEHLADVDFSTLDQQLQNLPLAGRQLCLRTRPAAPAHPLELSRIDDRREARRKENPPAQQRLDPRGDQIAPRIRLQNVTARPGREGFPNELFGLVHRRHEHQASRIVRHDPRAASSPLSSGMLNPK